MYKYVKAAYSPSGIEELQSIADTAGYEVEISDDKEMTVSCRKDADMMPEFEVFTEEEDNQFFFTPVLKFPEIDMRKQSYYDDAEYWVGKWAKAAELCSAIMNFSI